MGLVFREGDVPKPPPGFPQCGDFDGEEYVENTPPLDDKPEDDEDGKEGGNTTPRPDIPSSPNDHTHPGYIQGIQFFIFFIWYNGIVFSVVLLSSFSPRRVL